MATRLVRPITVIGQDAFIPLTRGYTAIIDAADVPLVSAWNWCARVNRHSVYAQRSKSVGGEKQNVLLHRLIINPPDGAQVDHKSGDGLDNRRANLRVATTSQNGCNQRIRSDNASGFKGVTFNKARGKWHARIQLNGKQRHLGSFANLNDAAAAYAEGSVNVHGEFGRVQ